MNEDLTKPLSVIRQEFIDQLVRDINNCTLPLFVIEPILQDLLNSVKTAAQEQYKMDKMQYEIQLKQKNEKE